MKFKIIALSLIVLLCFDASAQVRNTFWQTVKNTITGKNKNEKAYYVSSSTGSDANDGLTPETPFATITKVNALNLTTSTIKKVLFKRGDKFAGQITVSHSGTEAKKIIYDAYGTGEKPVIYGSEVITGWTLHSGNIYKATFNTAITQLFVNETRMKVARHPNTGYIAVTTVNSTTQFVASSLASQATDYYKGTKWIGRTNEWVMQTRSVTASTGNTLTLESAPTENLGVNEGFFLCNKLEFLDSPGEWFYDASTKTVYLWTLTGANPATYEVRGSTYDNGVYIINSNRDITINNLDVRQQKKNNVATTGSSYRITVSNCVLADAELQGIMIQGSINATNNRINGQNAYGIYSLGTNYNSVLAYNEVYDIALFDQLGLAGMGESDVHLSSKSGKAIEVETVSSSSINFYVHHNKVYNVGYSGICFYGQNHIIEYNHVKDVCLVKDDGSGIYTWGSAADQATPGNNGCIIRYNIVEGAIGSSKGKSSFALSGSGIYLDNNSGGVTVMYNIIAHCSLSGVFLHEGKLNTVSGNTIFDSDYGVYTVQDHGINTITGNTIYALNTRYNNTSFQKLIAERLATSQHVYSGNYYYSRYNSNDIFMRTAEWSDPSADSYSFSEWQALGKDAGSVIDVNALTAGATQSGIVINNSFESKTFYGNGATAKNITGASLAASFSHPGWSATIVTGMDLFKLSNENTVTLEPETIHYIENLAYQLTKERIAAINSAVRYLKTNLAIDSLNDVFDYFHLYGGETQESSLRDLIGSANATLSGTAPTFTRFQGFTGNGTSSYINTQFTPSTATTATLNSTAWGYYVRTQGATSTGIYGTLSTTADGGTANRVILSCPAATSDVFAVNAGLSNIAFTSGVGLTSVNRAASGTHKAFYNGYEVATANVTSTKLPNQTLYLLARHEADGSTNYYGSDQVSSSFFGRGLTEAEMIVVKNAIENYLNSVR